jgi:Inward rectifier potassium channel.
VYSCIQRSIKPSSRLNPFLHPQFQITILNPFLSPQLHIDQYDSDIFLLWPTIVVHRIDEESPLYDMAAKKLLTEKFEIIAILEGTTESTGQTTQAKTSYLPSEILWGHRFEPLVRYNREKVAYEVDYALFHNTNQVDTPLCSARELETLTQKLPRSPILSRARSPR